MNEQTHQQHRTHPSLESISQQLLCTFCMCVFKHPVTLECGHTFCRSCLLGYARMKYSCPICRASLPHINQQPSQDYVLGMVVDYLRTKSKEIQGNVQSKNVKLPSEDNQTSQGKPIKVGQSQSLLLLDIRSRDMLLPFTKIVGTFELQSPTLLSRLERFVVRQQMPFSKYGIISKITYINQLRYNVYECVIEGKQFCQICNEEIQRLGQATQQYFYRVCQAKPIYQDEDYDLRVFKAFYEKFSKIKDKAILTYIYKYIDPQKLNSRTNPLSAYYSILKIIAEPAEKKYQIATSFDQSKRMNHLKQFLLRSDEYNVAANPTRFLMTRNEGGISRELFLTFVMVVIGVFMFFMFGETDGLNQL